VGWRLLLGSAGAMAAVPTLGLAVMVGTGSAAPGAALAVLAATLTTAAALAAIWAEDLDRLTQTLRLAALEASPEPAPLLSVAAASPTLPPIARLARGVERLARTLADRVSQSNRLLRANEAIIERLPDLLLILGSDGAVRRANAAARTELGGDLGAVVRHPGLRAAIELAFARNTRQSVELTLPVPVRRDVQATVLVLDPPLADGGHAIAVLSDRTRERGVERMRADFVANASHELRTPLASLIGFIDTLRGPAADDPPAQRRFLGIMAEQAERMNRLIDDLLSLSRIELTEHRPPAEQVNLGELAERIAAAFEPQVRARSARLTLRLDPALPDIMADPDQLDQVLQNLIDNALKYGREQGHVQVEVTVALPGGRWPPRPGVVLSVADDGPGIPRAHVPRLTERFYRVNKGRSRGGGGTGLGLAIVKHIVNRHRGQLAIDSEEGRGTTFLVWLPQRAERLAGEQLGAMSDRNQPDRIQAANTETP